MIDLHAIQRPGPPRYNGWAMSYGNRVWHYYTDIEVDIPRMIIRAQNWRPPVTEAEIRHDPWHVPTLAPMIKGPVSKLCGRRNRYRTTTLTITTGTPHDRCQECERRYNRQAVR